MGPNLHTIEIYIAPPEIKPLYLKIYIYINTGNYNLDLLQKFSLEYSGIYLS